MFPMRIGLSKFLIIIVLIYGCKKETGIDEADKVLPPYCFGILTGNHTVTGYPFISTNKDTISDSLYHVGFHFDFIINDNYMDNRIIRYYGKAILIESTGYSWSTKKVIYEEELNSLYAHHIQKICNGCYDGSLNSNDTITYYIQYHFEIECLHKYIREHPPFVPLPYHVVEELITLN